MWGDFFITWIFPSCFCNLYILYYSSVHFPNWAQEYNAPAITCHLMILHFAFRNILGNRPHVFFWIIKGLIKVSLLALRRHLVGIRSKKSYKLCFKGASQNSSNPTAMFCEVHAGLSTSSCMSNRCVYFVFIGINHSKNMLSYTPFSGKHSGIWVVGSFLWISWVYSFSQILTSKVPKNSRKAVSWSVHFGVKIFTYLFSTFYVFYIYNFIQLK